MPLSFYLRNRFWGKMKLRRYLPTPPPSRHVSNEQQFYENILVRSLRKETRESIDLACDVGCRNWSYLPALAAGLPRAAFLGFEVDGGRRYWNLHRRIEAAQAYAATQVFDGRVARAVHVDFTEFEWERLDDDTQTLYTFFFPFVSERPCVKWGLPRKYADFGRLLERAFANEPTARILSCHQGEWEAEIAEKAYAATGARYETFLYPASEFRELWPSPHDVHVFVAEVGSKR